MKQYGDVLIETNMTSAHQKPVTECNCHLIFVDKAHIRNLPAFLNI